MTSSDLASDLLLLMMNVSQMRDHGRAISLFLESLDAMLAPVRFSIAETCTDEVTAIPVGTAKNQFGWLIASQGQLDASQTMTLQNAAQILGLALEKLRQDAYLAGERQRLETAVAARTAELARSERRARLMFECNAGAIVIHDQHGTIIDANAETCRLFNVSKEQVIGITVSAERWNARFSNGSPVLPNINPAALALRTGVPVRNVMIAFTESPGAVTRWLLVSSEPLFDETSDNVREVITTFQDITAIRQAEEQRRTFETRALQAQKLESLGVLAGGIAHDFNNLLTGILGNAALARDVVASESEAAESLLLIETAARQAAELTGQLLAYAGKGHVSARPIDLAQLIRETVPLLHVASNKRCPLQIDCCDSAWVHADASQLRQLIMNLVINAAEAVGDEPGFVRVVTRVEYLDEARLASAHLASSLPAGRFVVLEVTDNGCGLSPDCIDRIFEPFYSTKFTGRGLGLAAVRGIVKLHQGAVEIESTPGRGTTFRILLPVQAKAAHEARVHSSAPLTGSGLLLVVDDEVSVRTLASRALRMSGFEVLEASDGREALTLIEQNLDRLKLVLLDATMPHLDGRQTLSALRDRGIQTKIILSSGYTDLNDEETWRPMGVCAFLPKPFVPAALRALVQRVLDTGV